MRIFHSCILLATLAVCCAGRTGRCAEEHRRVVLIKTHKTGSSTLANIIYRFGEARNLSFLFPQDDLRLGWPGAFPGKFVDAGEAGKDANDRKTFDVVAFHAVLNHRTMLRFVPSAKFISIVRDPVSQFTSAWYFFKNGDLKVRSAANAGTKSEASLTLAAINSIFPPYRSAQIAHDTGRHVPVVDPTSVDKAAGASASVLKRMKVMNRLLNSQSFTLGWADFKTAVFTAKVSRAAAQSSGGVLVSKPFLPTAEMLEGDVNDTLIVRFFAYLDRVMDVILVVERLDESLVVLGRCLCWDLRHLEYLPVNVHKKAYLAGAKDDPLLAARLRQLLHVDEALYAFANTRLSRQLYSLREETIPALARDATARATSTAVPSAATLDFLRKDILFLQQRTAILGAECNDGSGRGNATKSSRCWRLLADQRAYCQHLKALRGIPCSRQKYKNTAAYNELPPSIQNTATRCELRQRQVLRGSSGNSRRSGGRGILSGADGKNGRGAASAGAALLVSSSRAPLLGIQKS
jgi:hypothetical protein